MANVLSIVTYKIFPPKLGGQKGIAFSINIFQSEVNLFCFTIQDNDPSGASYKVYNDMENGSGRYANIFNFTKIKKIIRENNISVVIVRAPLLWLDGAVIKKILQCKTHHSFT